MSHAGSEGPKQRSADRSSGDDSHQRRGRTDPRRRDVDWRSVRRFAIFACFSLAIILAVCVLYWSLLLPVLVGASFAYLLLPLVNRAETVRMPRALVVSVVVATAMSLVTLGVVRLVPALYTQVLTLLQLVPPAVSFVLESWVPWVESALSELGLAVLIDTERIFSAVDFANEIGSYLQSGLYGLWNTGTTVLGGVINVLLVPLVAFILLYEQRRITRGVYRLIPEDLVEPVGSLCQRIDVTLRAVIKGQALVAATLTVLYVIGFSIVQGIWGLQSAIAIAVVAGICRIIPYFDVVVGLTLSSIVILSDFQGWGQFLGVGLIFVVVQTVDGVLITPRIIGERIGLHPVIVILSVIAFADWFGFWGVLLVIPTIAVTKTLLSTAIPYYRVSQAFSPTWWRRGEHHRRKSDLSSSQPTSNSLKS